MIGRTDRSGPGHRRKTHGTSGSAEEELETLALEGLNSGEPIEVGPGYGEEKHRRLAERLNKTSAQ